MIGAQVILYSLVLPALATYLSIRSIRWATSDILEIKPRMLRSNFKNTSQCGIALLQE